MIISLGSLMSGWDDGVCFGVPDAIMTVVVPDQGTLGGRPHVVEVELVARRTCGPSRLYEFAA